MKPPTANVAKRDATTCTLSVPEGLDLDTVPVRLRRDAMLFCSLLHRKWVSWKTDRCGWVRLKYSTLKNLIDDRQLRAVITTLMDLGVVERSDRYRAGMYSRSYRLAPSYRQSKVVTIKSKCLKRRLTALECPKLPVHLYLEQQLQYLKIDRYRASSLVAQLQPDNDCKMSVDDYNDLLWEQCRCFEQGFLPLSRDPYDRCHSIFTRLRRELRSCLSLHEQPLVGFDLANSQPLFAALLAILYHSGYAEQLRNHAFHRHAHSINQSYLEGVEASKIRLISRGVLGGGVPGVSWGSRGGVAGLPQLLDLESFLAVCVSGKYYESFSADRGRVKKAMMPILSGPVCYQNSHIVQQFKTIYPSADAMLVDLKTNNTLPKAIRHKQSSRLLQHIEASMFIGRICQRAMMEGVPVVTLHDGLFSTPQDLPALQSIAEQEFQRLGFVPTFKPV